jgi:DNA polymerase-3 subunit alpha
MYTINDVLIFDSETTGLPKKGEKWENDFMYFPDIVSLAWSFRGVDKNFIIKPNGWVIPDEAAAIHGITTEIAEKNGVDLEIVLDAFYLDAGKAPLICAHNIYFDSSMIKANTLKYMGRPYYNELAEESLGKEKRIDTMMKTIKFVGALRENGTPGKFPKLEELYDKLFPGEKFDAHDSLEDVLALKRCLPELVNLGIIELKIKEYPAEQTKIEFDKKASRPKTRTTIIFDDKSHIPSINDSQTSDLILDDINDVDLSTEKQQKLKDIYYENPISKNSLLDEDNF